MDDNLKGIATTAKISGHPLHPLLVPVPIGLWVATLLADIGFAATGDAFWAGAAFWALGGAIVFALIAAIAGFTDFFGNRRIRDISDAWKHMIGNLAAVAVAVVSLILRLSGGDGAVVPWGLILSVVTVLLVLYTGWKGGELVYRHRVGMLPNETTP
jgi:uncharacterized membrane protein